MVSPPQPPSTLLINKILSVLLNAKLFLTSGFCSCCFLCLEHSSFCFSHDWVFLILQVLTEMSLPQQSLRDHAIESWFPLLLSLYPLSFIVLAIIRAYFICSFGYFHLDTLQYYRCCESRAGVYLIPFVLSVSGPVPGRVHVLSVLFEWIISCGNTVVLYSQVMAN